MEQSKEGGGEKMDPVVLKLKNILIDKAKILFIIFLLMMIFSGIWMFKTYSGSAYEEQNITSYTHPRQLYIFSLCNEAKPSLSGRDQAWNGKSCVLLFRLSNRRRFVSYTDLKPQILLTSAWRLRL